jgi:hypothetical protein
MSKNDNLRIKVFDGFANIIDEKLDNKRKFKSIIEQLEEKYR